MTTDYSRVLSIEWAAIEDYYQDPAEIERKRPAWDRDSARWLRYRDEAIEAHEEEEREKLVLILARMEWVETGWGGAPATREVRRLLLCATPLVIDTDMIGEYPETWDVRLFADILSDLLDRGVIVADATNGGRCTDEDCDEQTWNRALDLWAEASEREVV